DWEFAERFDLPIVRTVQPVEGFDGKAYIGEGPAINSRASHGFSLDGLEIADAKKAIIGWLEEHGYGQGATTYRLRDWLFSRQRYVRETNTMPQWAGSCWYELRYLDPTNDKAFVDPENERYWMGPKHAGDCGGVDLYVGGVEHAVLHLLYARFWHKVLYDLGYISSFEPFRRLFNQGYIQAYAYTDERGSYVTAEEVEEVAGGYAWNGKPVTREYGKM